MQVQSAGIQNRPLLLKILVNNPIIDGWNHFDFLFYKCVTLKNANITWMQINGDADYSSYIVAWIKKQSKYSFLLFRIFWLIFQFSQKLTDQCRLCSVNDALSQSSFLSFFNQNIVEVKWMDGGWWSYILFTIWVWRVGISTYSLGKWRNSFSISNFM